MLSGIRSIAEEKHTTMEKLVQAYVLSKNPDMSLLIGTTRKEHLQDSIDALSVELSPEDIQRIEAAFPAEKLQSINMPYFTFRDGKVVQN